jgi:hypothetical protein
VRRRRTRGVQEWPSPVQGDDAIAADRAWSCRSSSRISFGEPQALPVSCGETVGAAWPAVDHGTWRRHLRAPHRLPGRGGFKLPVLTRTGNGRQPQHRDSAAPIAEYERLRAAPIRRTGARRSSSSGYPRAVGGTRRSPLGSGEGADNRGGCRRLSRQSVRREGSRSQVCPELLAANAATAGPRPHAQTASAAPASRDCPRHHEPASADPEPALIASLRSAMVAMSSGPADKGRLACQRH